MNVSSRPPLCLLYKLIRLASPYEKSHGNEGDNWENWLLILQVILCNMQQTTPYRFSRWSKRAGADYPAPVSHKL